MFVYLLYTPGVPVVAETDREKSRAKFGPRHPELDTPVLVERPVDRDLVMWCNREWRWRLCSFVHSTASSYSGGIETGEVEIVQIIENLHQANNCFKITITKSSFWTILYHNVVEII